MCVPLSDALVRVIACLALLVSGSSSFCTSVALSVLWTALKNAWFCVSLALSVLWTA